MRVMCSNLLRSCPETTLLPRHIISITSNVSNATIISTACLPTQRVKDAHHRPHQGESAARPSAGSALACADDPLVSGKMKRPKRFHRSLRRFTGTPRVPQNTRTGPILLESLAAATIFATPARDRVSPSSIPCAVRAPATIEAAMIAATNRRPGLFQDQLCLYAPAGI